MLSRVLSHSYWHTRYSLYGSIAPPVLTSLALPLHVWLLPSFATCSFVPTRVQAAPPQVLYSVSIHNSITNLIKFMSYISLTGLFEFIDRLWMISEPPLASVWTLASLPVLRVLWSAFYHRTWALEGRVTGSAVFRKLFKGDNVRFQEIRRTRIEGKSSAVL